MTRRQRIDDLTAFAVPEQPALSPDGAQILYVLRTQDGEADRSARGIWRVGTRTGEPERLTRGPADVAPAWSPDGTRVAFLRAVDGPAQVWLLPMGGGEPEQLTTLPLGAGAPVWSPDGRRIAFSAAVDLHAGRRDRRHRAGGDEAAGLPADGAGLLKTMRKHLHVLDVSTKECRQVTGGDWHAGDPAWSPDSATLAYAAATAPDADLVTRAPVYVIDATQPGASPVLVGLADGVGGPLVWAAADVLLVGRDGRGAGGPRRTAAPVVEWRRAGGEPGRRAGPQRDAGRPGLPGRRAGARRGWRHRGVLRPRPGLQPPLRGLRPRWTCSPGARRRRPGRGRDVGRGRYRGGRAGHGHLVRRGGHGRPQHRCGDGAHPARRPRRRRTVRAAAAPVRHLRRHHGRGLAGPRPGGDRADAAAARHPRRPAQRVERRGRRGPPVPPGAGRPRLDGADPQPPRQRRLRRRASTTPPWARGARRTRSDFLEPLDALVADGTPTRGGSRSPATATAAS